MERGFWPASCSTGWVVKPAYTSTRHKVFPPLQHWSMFWGYRTLTHSPHVSVGHGEEEEQLRNRNLLRSKIPPLRPQDPFHDGSPVPPDSGWHMASLWPAYAHQVWRNDILHNSCKKEDLKYWRFLPTRVLVAQHWICNELGFRDDFEKASECWR